LSLFLPLSDKRSQAVEKHVILKRGKEQGKEDRAGGIRRVEDCKG
jgi:hypothetical protein